MTTWAQRILNANEQFEPETWKLPRGIHALDPFGGSESDSVRKINEAFYQKFYNDDQPRKLILGINPGRLGAGATGVPFTDTKRMEAICGISAEGMRTHEPSSVFVYEVIEAYGGVERFYNDVFIHSVCPLGFVKEKLGGGKAVNYNYYDDRQLEEAVTPYITKWLNELASWPVRLDQIYCLGSGKNFKFLQKWNKEHQLFGKIIPLDHPRFVMQYRAKRKAEYIDKYLIHLKSK